MAGKKGRSGGARPGAGRKKREVVVEQANRRDVVLQVIGDPEWRALLESWLVMAHTTPSVIYPLLPYLLGASKQDPTSQGSSELTVRIVTVDDRDRRPDIRVLGAG